MNSKIRYLGGNISLNKFYGSSFSHYDNAVLIINGLFVNADGCFDKETNKEFIYFKPSALEEDKCNFYEYDKILFESQLCLEDFLDSNKEEENYYNGKLEIIKPSDDVLILNDKLEKYFKDYLDEDKIIRVKKKYGIPRDNKVIIYISPNEMENRTNNAFSKELEEYSLKNNVSIFSYNKILTSKKIRKLEDAEELADIFFVSDIVIIPDEKILYLGPLCTLLNYPRYFLYIENSRVSSLIDRKMSFGEQIPRSDYYSGVFKIWDILGKNNDYYTDKVIEKMFIGD